MTSEISSAPELIYYCEYNLNDFEDRLEIPFTNEYDIKLKFSRNEDDQVCINVDLQSKESNIPKEFFGKNILNVTAIAGKNGVGKTRLLNTLDSGKINEINIKNKNDRMWFKNIASNSIAILKYQTKYFVHSVSIWDFRRKISVFENGKQCKVHNIEKFSGLLIGDNRFNDRELFSGKFIKKLTLSSKLKFFIDPIVADIFSLKFILKDKYQIMFSSKTSLEWVDEQYRSFDGDDGDESEYSVLKNEIKKTVNQIDKRLLRIRSQHFFMTNGNISRYKERINKLFLIEIIINCFNKQINSNFIKSYKDLLHHQKAINDLSNRLNNVFFDIVTGKIISSDSIDINYLNSLLLSQTCFKDNQEKVHIGLVSLVKFFAELDDNFFISKNEVEIPKFDISIVTQLIDELSESFPEIHNILDVQIGRFSTGELSLVEHFAQISSNLEDYREKDSLCLLIDEYEQHLHPEWSRKYLSYLLRFLDAEGKRLGIKFQVILTTHSPYLISDLPKENIVLLEKDEQKGKRTTRKSNYGFASNYYDILSDSFFLEDTIGEFAKQKINGWITELNELKESSDSDLEKLTRIDELKELINIVDDQFIRNKLLGLAEDVRKTILKQADKDLRASLIDKEIEKLVEMKRKLNEENRQDD